MTERVCRKYPFLSHYRSKCVCVCVGVYVYVCVMYSLESSVWVSHEGLGRTETPHGELRSNQSWNGLDLNQNQMTRIGLHWLRHELQLSVCVCVCVCVLVCVCLSIPCAHKYCCFWIKKRGICWFFFFHPAGMKKRKGCFMIEIHLWKQTVGLRSSHS